MVASPSVAIQSQPALVVDLNNLFKQKCESALWKNSVFCAMGSGSRAGEMIGSIRIVPGKDGEYSGKDTSTAWKFYNLFQLVKNVIDKHSMVRGVVQKFPWYKQYLAQLERLSGHIEAGAPIPIDLLDGLAEMFYALIQYPVVGNRVKAYLRNTTNIALFDMPTYDVPPPATGWFQWVKGLFGW